MYYLSELFRNKILLAAVSLVLLVLAFEGGLYLGVHYLGSQGKVQPCPDKCVVEDGADETFVHPEVLRALKITEKNRVEEEKFSLTIKGVVEYLDQSQLILRDASGSQFKYGFLPEEPAPLIQRTTLPGGQVEDIERSQIKPNDEVWFTAEFDNRTGKITQVKLNVFTEETPQSPAETEGS